MHQQHMEINFDKVTKSLKVYHRLAIMLSLIVMFVVVFGNEMIFPDKYEASATVQVKTSALETAEGNEERISIVQEEILSRSVLEKVVEDLDLTKPGANPSWIQKVLLLANIETKKKKMNPDVVVRDLQSNVTIVQSEHRQQTELFVISTRDSSATYAADVINAIVNSYISHKSEFKSTDAESTVAFLEIQVKKLQSGFNIASQKLNSFRTLNADNLVSSDTLDETMFQIKMDLVEANSRATELKARRSTLSVALASEPQYLLSGDEVNENNISPTELLERLGNQLKVFQAKYTPEHPKVLNTKDKIRNLRRVLRTSVTSDAYQLPSNPEYISLKSELRGVESQIQATTAEIASLRQQRSDIQAQKRKAPTITATMAMLQTTLDKAAADYIEMQNQLSNARVKATASRTNVGDNFKIIDPAVAPETPLVRSRLILYAFGIVLGLGVGIGIAVLKGLIVEPNANATASSKFSNFMFYTSATTIFIIIIAYIGIDTVNRSLEIL